MGGGVISFGLCVILVCILGRQSEVKASPIPLPSSFDLCTYLRPHSHGSRTHGSTTVAPAEDKPKDEKNDKLDLFSKLLRDLFDLEKEADKKKEEEKKKKEEEEKKKKEEEEKKKKEEAKDKDKKKNEPKGFQSWDELWEMYIKFFSAVYYSI